MPLYSVTIKTMALAAATAKTAIQIVAPAGKDVRLRSWRVSFDGVTASAVPGDVDVLRQTTAGTSTAATPVILAAGSPVAGSSAGTNFTAEPTGGDVLDSLKVTPNGGIWGESYARDDAPVIAASGRLGIRLNFPAGVNTTVTAVIEE